MNNNITGWHFSQKNQLQYNDPRTIVLGEILSLDPEKPVIPCKSGFHCSEFALDALQYAPGNTLWRVELSGDLQSHGKPPDKWVGRHRKAIAGDIDATEMVLKFVRDCALDVGNLWDMPAVVRKFLVTGNPELVKTARAAIDATINAPRNTDTVARNAAIYAAVYAVYVTNNARYNDAIHTAINAAYAVKAGYDYKPKLQELQKYKQKFNNLCLNLLK